MPTLFQCLRRTPRIQTTQPQCTSSSSTYSRYSNKICLEFNNPKCHQPSEMGKFSLRVNLAIQQTSSKPMRSLNSEWTGKTKKKKRAKSRGRATEKTIKPSYRKAKGGTDLRQKLKQRSSGRMLRIRLTTGLQSATIGSLTGKKNARQASTG